MRTRAEQVDGGWMINGNKTWCSSAHVADYILLLARTDDNVAKRHQGVTLFLLDAKAEGVNITELPQARHARDRLLRGRPRDVFVPDAVVLGEPGQAWYMLLPTLNNERIMVGAFCCGILDGVLEDALDYVKQREAFGKKIGEFQTLQHYIADIAMMRDQAELIVYHAALLLNAGQAVPPGGDHGQGHRLRVRGQGRRPGHPDPRRHGLLRRDRHAALLARRAAVEDRPDHQRDGPQRDRREPRPAAVVLMKIVVPVKHVATLDEDYELIDAARVDPDSLDFELNEWDAFAVEAALQLRDAAGEGEVVAVTVGDDESRKAC